jgi:hypothetical protein
MIIKTKYMEAYEMSNSALYSYKCTFDTVWRNLDVAKSYYLPCSKVNKILNLPHD